MLKPMMLFALVLSALLGACSFHETRTVQPAPQAVIADTPPPVATTTTSTHIGF
jgi:hypothetical protein